VRNITYDITELYAFIDNLGDLCCLVYNGSGAYEPHNKQVPVKKIHALHLSSNDSIALTNYMLFFFIAITNVELNQSSAAVGQGPCLRTPQADGPIAPKGSPTLHPPQRISMQAMCAAVGSAGWNKHTVGSRAPW
jgi:hypothetical protein